MHLNNAKMQSTASKLHGQPYAPPGTICVCRYPESHARFPIAVSNLCGRINSVYVKSARRLRWGRDNKVTHASGPLKRLTIVADRPSGTFRKCTKTNAMTRQRSRCDIIIPVTVSARPDAIC